MLRSVETYVKTGEQSQVVYMVTNWKKKLKKLCEIKKFWFNPSMAPVKIVDVIQFQLSFTTCFIIYTVYIATQYVQNVISTLNISILGL